MRPPLLRRGFFWIAPELRNIEHPRNNLTEKPWSGCSTLGAWFWKSWKKGGMKNDLCDQFLGFLGGFKKAESGLKKRLSGQKGPEVARRATWTPD